MMEVASVQKPVLLEISHVEDTYRFRLEQPEPGAAVRQYATPPISRADQQSLRRAVEQAARSPLNPFSLEELGRLMYNLLLPAEIQDFLRCLDAPLLISTDAPEIPWELFYEETSKQFVGLKCAVGRRLVTDAAVSPRADAATDTPLAFLLIGNPQGDLDGADREIQLLSELITASGGTVRTLLGSRAGLLPVQLALQSEQSYLGIHYAGHADHDKASRQHALLLAERTKLTADAIRKLLRGQPFVFLNACGTDQPSQSGRRAAISWQVTEGLAAAFVAGGARAVLATRWEVDDQRSAAFAAHFYEAALLGVPIGEALRRARVRCREEQSDDSTWAAFVLYGDPCQPLVDVSVFGADGELRRARFSPDVSTALDLLPGEAQQSGYDFVGTPHLFIALARIEGGCTQDALRRLGRPPHEVCERLRRDIRRGRPAASAPRLARPSLSERVRRILQAASDAAIAAGSSLIGERHLLEGFLREADGPTVESLRRQGIDPERLRAILHGEPEPEGAVAVASSSAREKRAELTFAPDAQQALTVALQEACRTGASLIETPHLVIGLTKVPGGYTAGALGRQGFDPKRVRDAIRAALRPAGPPREMPAAITPELLAPRVQQIVELAAAEARAAGHTAIGERHLLLAFLQTEGSATAEFLRSLGIDLKEMAAAVRQSPEGPPQPSPTPLLDRLGRDLTRLAREGRLKPVIGRRKEMARIAQVLARSDKNTPLLIGDAGVGKTAIVEGLAQRIADGRVPPHLQGKRIVELQVAALVAGTKYRGELEERLAQVLREATQPDVILFLDEIHTLVGAGRGEGTTLDAGNIFKPALARGEIRCIGATTLAEFRKTIEKDAALERRFQRIMVEEPSPGETLEILQQTRSRYESHHGVRLLDEALEAAVRMSVAYLPDRHLPDKACDLIDEACVRLRVGSASQWPSEAPGAESPVVDAEAVARVVAEWTGIPVGRLTEPEQERLLGLEELLGQRVVGQDEAVTAVAEAVRQARAGLKRPRRPVGVFLFVGPTGVGKTELARALAEVLFGSPEELIRLDMSEYQEPHSVSRLVGAPPGYVGYGEGGQLTGALRRKPYAVVLMDEIEKAHPNVFDLFLQLFDEGHLTDSQGRTANGRNAIFILTCNVASDVVRRHTMGFGRDNPETARQDVMDRLRQTFRPEFLNRLDEVVVFRPLSPEHVRAIAHRHAAELSARLQASHGVTLQVGEEALDLICRAGYSEMYGARHLQRAFEQMLTRPLSTLLLTGRRGTIVARAEGDRVTLSWEG